MYGIYAYIWLIFMGNVMYVNIPYMDAMAGNISTQHGSCNAEELKNGYLAIKDGLTNVGWWLRVTWWDIVSLKTTTLDHHMTNLFGTTNKIKKRNTCEWG